MRKVNVILFITFRRMSATEENVLWGNGRMMGGNGIPIFRRSRYSRYKTMSGDATYIMTLEEKLSQRFQTVAVRI